MSVGSGLGSLAGGDYPVAPGPPPGPPPPPVVTAVEETGLPKLLVDWAQVLGAAFGAVALVAAFFAIWKAKRDLAVERKRQHELEILRDIGSLLAEPGSTVEMGR